jgi:ABC-2 type transport system ATP-binding protein
MSAADNGLAVDLHHVSKKYRRVEALRGIEMRVRRGEIFGLLGANGAGKSTLVKIMMTVVRPTRARGTVLGRAVGHKPTLAKVGYLPENHRFPDYLTGRQVLDFFAAMAKVDRRTRRRRASELLDRVGLQKWGKARVRTYSKGMQQRLGLAQALMNDPQLLVLDEPTDGLDPVGRREVREILRELRERGKTVFLNSHLLGEVERVCDRVAILSHGEVVSQGTIDELTAGSERYEIELQGAPGGQLRETVHAVLPCKLEAKTRDGESATLVEGGTLASGTVVELEGSVLRIISGDPVAIQPVLDALRGGGLVI